MRHSPRELIWLLDSSSCLRRIPPPLHPVPSEKTTNPNLVIHATGAVKVSDMGPNIVSIARDLNIFEQPYRAMHIGSTMEYEPAEVLAGEFFGLPSCRCGLWLCCELSTRITAADRDCSLVCYTRMQSVGDAAHNCTPSTSVASLIP